MARYPNGQPVRVAVTVTDLGGTLAAVTPVLTLQLPDGTQQPYSSPVADSTGQYHQDIPAADLSQNGHYQWSAVAAGSVTDPAVGAFDVFDPFEVRVLGLDDAKEMLNIPASVTAHDAELDGWIASIESGLERFTGGPVTSRPVTERCSVDGCYSVIAVRQRPLVSVESITGVATGTGIDVTQLDLDKNAGLIRMKTGWPFLGPFFVLDTAVTVTYTAGWGTAVPPAFNSFARIVIQHMWQTRRGPIAMPMAGEQAVAVPGFGFAIPNRAAELLNGSQDGVPFACEAYV